MNWLESLTPWFRRKFSPRPQRALTPQEQIAKEALSVLESCLRFQPSIARNCEYRSGDEIKIKRPSRFSMKDEQNEIQTDT